MLFLLGLWYILSKLISSSNYYMNSLSSLLILFLSSGIVFMVFLIFTELSMISMILILLVLLIYGYYLNFDIRKMVRTGLLNDDYKDAYSGSIKLFLEGFLVFFRFMELLGRMLLKTK